MLIIKAILLTSFIGLAVIIVKQRVTNPEMRVRFFEDVERNKKRIVIVFSALTSGVRRGGGALFSYLNILFRYTRKGIRLFFKDLVRMLGVVRSGIVRQVKELREDMKTFEIPKHKKDFLERLHEEQVNSGKKQPAAKLPKNEEREKEEAGELPDTFKKEELLEVKPVQGFQVRAIEVARSPKEVEIDRRILQKKEQGLLDAIVKNPRNPNFYKKLGKVYLLMNNNQDARSCLEYAIKLGAQDPEVKSLLLEIKKEALHR